MSHVIVVLKEIRNKDAALPWLSKSVADIVLTGSDFDVSVKKGNFTAHINAVSSVSRLLVAEMESLEGLFANDLAISSIVRPNCADICVQSTHVSGSKHDLLTSLPVKTRRYIE